MPSILQHFPLGATIPNTPHAVCCSLPTLDDVIGYEEKRPETISQVKYAYPRFVLHDYVVRAMKVISEKYKRTDRWEFLLPSQAAAEDLSYWISQTGMLADFSVQIFQESDFVIVSLPRQDEVFRWVKAYLQHTGLCISSRHAEDILIRNRVFPASPTIDIYFASQSDSAMESEQVVRRALHKYLPTDALHLANCGMNAFYGALRAARKVQAPRGRTKYLQLGWLYLDTQRILEQFLGGEDSLTVQLDVFDEAKLRAFFAEHGDDLAAVVTELPTNPLIQTPNVVLLQELCAKHGVVRIFDPTIAGIPNVDVLPHTDLLVTSLTKYAAHYGDVMIGAAAVNPDSPFAAELTEAIVGLCEPPYVRDLDRLAEQIETMPEVAAKQSANTRGLVEWLEKHPAVSKVWHPRSEKCAANFEKIARSPDSYGAVFTIELNKPLSEFYDRARVVKGPSFGTSFTMMCPFMYLAHFDDVSTEEGRAYLQKCGLNPELVRVSSGAEDLAEIIQALEEGLGV